MRVWRNIPCRDTLDVERDGSINGAQEYHLPPPFPLPLPLLTTFPPSLRLSIVQTLVLTSDKKRSTPIDDSGAHLGRWSGPCVHTLTCSNVVCPGCGFNRPPCRQYCSLPAPFKINCFVQKTKPRNVFDLTAYPELRVSRRPGRGSNKVINGVRRSG